MKISKKLKLLIIILLVNVSYGLSQNGRIKGRVYDKTNNKAISYASIVIEDTNIGTVTDEKGNFVFENVKPGFMRLDVRFLGYANALSTEIQVQGNQTTFINIAMEASSNLLDEVIIKGRRGRKRIESPLSVMHIEVQEIEKTAGINRDISKLAQTLPGVGVTDPNRNDLIVRGGGPSENVFYLDGIEIPVINHFTTQGSSGGAIGIINPDFVQDLNFYTAAFPANRTDALSSIMDIRQRDGDRERFHSKLAIGASDAGITLEGPIGKKSSFIASARQSYLQFLFDALGLPFLPTYNDFQLKYKTEINSKNHLTFIGIGAIDNMKLNKGLKNPDEAQRYILNYLPTYKQWNYTIGFVYKHFGERHYDTWVMSRNMLRNKNFKYPQNDESKPKVSDYISDEIENKFRFERQINTAKMGIMWGVGMKYATYNNSTHRSDIINGKINRLDYSSKLNLFFYKAFAQISNRYFQERLKLSLGISFVGNNFNNDMLNPIKQFSPRLSGTLNIYENIDFNMNIGRYTAPPSYTTFGYRDSDHKLINKNIKYIYSDHIVVGLEYKQSNKSRLTIEGFYKKYSNYPFSVNEGLSIASKGADYGQVGDEEIVSIGKGKAYGVEFLLKNNDIKNLNITATYTIFRSRFSDKNNNYIPSSWDTRALVNILANYKLDRNWNIAMRWRWMGGAPYSPADMELSTNRNLWDIRQQIYQDYNNFNSLRLSPSHQLDLRIDKEFYFKKWVLNLYIDIQNAYNFKSSNPPIYTNLDVDGTPQIDANDKSKYILRQIESKGGNILPTIGLIIKI